MDLIFNVLAYLAAGIVVASLWRRFTDSNNADNPEVLVIFVILWPFMIVAVVSYHLVICFSNLLYQWPRRSSE